MHKGAAQMCSTKVQRCTVSGNLWDTYKVLVHCFRISGTVTVTCIAKLAKQTTLQIAGVLGPHLQSSRAFTLNLWQSHAD